MHSSSAPMNSKFSRPTARRRLAPGAAAGGLIARQPEQVLPNQGVSSTPTAPPSAAPPARKPTAATASRSLSSATPAMRVAAITAKRRRSPGGERGLGSCADDHETGRRGLRTAGRSNAPAVRQTGFRAGSAGVAFGRIVERYQQILHSSRASAMRARLPASPSPFWPSNSRSPMEVLSAPPPPRPAPRAAARRIGQVFGRGAGRFGHRAHFQRVRMMGS